MSEFKEPQKETNFLAGFKIEGDTVLNAEKNHRLREIKSRFLGLASSEVEIPVQKDLRETLYEERMKF
jgi:hypothetical protein